MNIDNISYLVLYFVLIKGEMLKTEFECEYNNSCQCATVVVVVQVDVGVYSIVYNHLYLQVNS